MKQRYSQKIAQGTTRWQPCYLWNALLASPGLGNIMSYCTLPIRHNNHHCQHTKAPIKICVMSMRNEDHADDRLFCNMTSDGLG